MKRINSWAWIDDTNAMHIEVDAALTEMGQPVTPENVAMFLEDVKKLCKESPTNPPVIQRFD